MKLHHLSQEHTTILTQVRKRDCFWEISPQWALSFQMAQELKDYLFKIDLFVAQQLHQWWRLVSIDAVGRDSLVMESDEFPTLVRKWYRLLTHEQIEGYYKIMKWFWNRLRYCAPSFQLKYGWVEEQFTFDPKQVKVVVPEWGFCPFSDSLWYCLYGVDLPKVSGEMLNNLSVGNQLDYLFTCFVEEVYGWEKVQKIFFPFKKIDTPLKIFQYPNLRKREDGSIVLLDVNRIQHVIRTIDTY